MAYVNPEWEYQLPGDPSGSWYTEEQLASVGYSLDDTAFKRLKGSKGPGTPNQGGKPAYWDFSPYRDTIWPPKKWEVNPSTGEAEWVTDTKKIEDYRTWEENRIRKYAEAKAKAEQENFQQQNTTTDNQRAAQEFNYRQQQDAIAASRQSKSIEQLILDAFVSGDREKAIALRDFRDAPTKQESMRFAMQYADSEAEFWTLYNLSQGFISPTPFGLGNLQLPGPNVQEGVRLGLLPPEYAKVGGVSPFNLRGATDYLTPSKLANERLKQDYLKASGGILPGQAATSLPTNQRPGGPFGLATNQSLETVIQDPVVPPEERAAARAELDARTAFTLPQGTPANRTDSSLMFENDRTLESILSAPETSEGDKAAAQAEADRRAIISRQQLAAGADGSFASFMAGGPDVSGKLTGQEAANLAAGPTEEQIKASGAYWIPGKGWAQAGLQFDAEGKLIPYNQLQKAEALPTNQTALTSLSEYFNRRRRARLPQSSFITPLNAPAR